MEPKRPTRIKLSNRPERPLTEKQIVDATVAFANGATLELKDLVDHRDWSFDGIHREISDALIGDRALENAEIRRAKETGNEPRTIQQIRKEGRERTRLSLWECIHEPIVPEKWDAKDLEELFSMDLYPRISTRPYFRRTEKGFTLDTYYTFATDLDLVTLGIHLLEDTERSFGKLLCQCELESCGLFFFEIKPPMGRPQRKYCCNDHMQTAHTQNAAKRMRRKRGRKPKGRK